VTYLESPPDVSAVEDSDVVDLGPTVSATRIVLDGDLGPLDRLAPDARRRLLVRVLCGLVAYEDGQARTRLAG
jgi:hypothetical protein